MSVAVLTVYSVENRRLGEISEDRAQGMISHGVAKLIRSRDGKIRELHLIDETIQDTGLEEVRQSYLEQMVNSRKTCYKENLYESGDKTGLWRYRLKYCSF